MLFHPELVAGFHVALDLVGAGLAGVDDDAVVFGLGDGADPFTEEAREEVVPGLEAVVGSRGVCLEHLVEGVVGFTVEVADSGHVL